MNRLTAFLLGAALPIPVWAGAADKLENSKLVWKPTTTVAKLGGIDTHRYSQIALSRLTDSRADPGLIGENREEKKARKVTTVEDVPAFTTDQLKKLWSGADWPWRTSRGNRPRRPAREVFRRRDGRLHRRSAHQVHGQDSSGKDCGRAPSSGTRAIFGRSYKAENYYETLSDWIVQAAVNLFRDSGLRRALGAK